MGAGVLDDFRAAIDAAPDVDRATFVRRARNAAAKAVVGAAFDARARPPAHEPPADEIREHVGPDLAEALVAVYGGSEDWPSRAIDVIEPLHALARG